MNEQNNVENQQQQELSTALTGNEVKEIAAVDAVETTEPSKEESTKDAQTEQETQKQGEEIKSDEEGLVPVKSLQERLKRQERVHRREMQEVTQSMQAQFAQTLQTISLQSNGANVPTAVSPQSVGNDSIDQKVNNAVQNIFRQQEEQRLAEGERKKTEAFNLETTKMMDKYDDYKDVVSEVTPYFNHAMLFALKNLPNGGLENFYRAWKENPDSIINISKLPLEQQALAVARLDAETSLKHRGNTSQQSGSNKLLSPLKPTGRSFTDPLSNDYESMINDILKK